MDVIVGGVIPPSGLPDCLYKAGAAVIFCPVSVIREVAIDMLNEFDWSEKVGLLEFIMLNVSYVTLVWLCFKTTDFSRKFRIEMTHFFGVD
ncbi:MAG: hypothetical protein IPH20_00810 [Bacteroidales bacterium]|nr:hypothetical protein [Bacteroidales bacterium]